LATLTAHYGASEGPAAAAVAEERRQTSLLELLRTVILGSTAAA
jgi:hypothetical protein